MSTSTIRLKRGTAAQWTTQDPVLLLGEPGFERDTGKVKIGDGTSLWSALSYVGGGGGGGVAGNVTVTITGPAGGSLEWSQTVSAAGLNVGDRVHLQLAPEDNALENGPEMLDVVSLTGSCQTDDTLTVALTFSTPTRGPIPLIYGVI